MNDLLQRWLKLAPREQWLVYGGGLMLLGMLYMLLLGDPLSLRVSKQASALKVAQARLLEASNASAELQARLAADPNLTYRSALLAESATREQLLGAINSDTATLVRPAQMKQLLRNLLQSQPQLRLLALESFSSPLALPESGLAEAEKGGASPPALLFRHGVKLTLEGGFFDLLTYLQAVQASGWKLYWDSLEYKVGKQGHAQAEITLQLYTVSQEAGWVGV
jgi:MSHA biogenesis protein MshJ